jgi:hypothetical protein
MGSLGRALACAPAFRLPTRLRQSSPDPSPGRPRFRQSESQRPWVHRSAVSRIGSRGILRGATHGGLGGFWRGWVASGVDFYKWGRESRGFGAMGDLSMARRCAGAVGARVGRPRGVRSTGFRKSFSMRWAGGTGAGRVRKGWWGGGFVRRRRTILNIQTIRET